MSTINPSNIDSSFPVAGADNDSAGFRTNFSNIKKNFSAARTEVIELQQKAILKSAIEGTTLNNNMGGAAISNVQLNQTSTALVAIGAISDVATINVRSGNYHSYLTAAPTTIDIINWPAAGNYCVIRIEIVVGGDGHPVQLPIAVVIGRNGIQGLDTTTNTLTLPYTAGDINDITARVANTFVFEFATYDGGATISINDVSRARDQELADETMALINSKANAESVAIALDQKDTVPDYVFVPWRRGREGKELPEPWFIVPYNIYTPPLPGYTTHIAKGPWDLRMFSTLIKYSGVGRQPAAYQQLGWIDNGPGIEGADNYSGSVYSYDIAFMDKMSSSYFSSTFGDNGLAKTQADFVVMMFTQNDSLPTRTITKSGAALRWDVNDTITFQNNFPAYTRPVETPYPFTLQFLTQVGMILMSSTDGFGGITSLDLSGLGLTYYPMFEPTYFPNLDDINLSNNFYEDGITTLIDAFVASKTTIVDRTINVSGPNMQNIFDADLSIIENARTNGWTVIYNDELGNVITATRYT